MTLSFSSLLVIMAFSVMLGFCSRRPLSHWKQLVFWPRHTSLIKKRSTISRALCNSDGRHLFMEFSSKTLLIISCPQLTLFQFLFFSPWFSFSSIYSQILTSIVGSYHITKISLRTKHFVPVCKTNTHFHVSNIGKPLLISFMQWHQPCCSMFISVLSLSIS